MSYKEPGLAVNTRPEADANMKLHIDALRELAQALIKEVEDLGTEQPVVSSNDLSFYDEVRRFEINLICQALTRTGGQQKRAARLLGVKATTLNSKIKRYRIDWDTQRNLSVSLQTGDGATSTFDGNPRVLAMQL
ncbi:MAG: Bacterial regulatory protein Fis family [Blastocatellia bacterium]|jgi:transcriptional regulator with GAF, ATPase, and Fis domain|nr:Bacterial regulatory protein Fis family [Blastocatellia bacterium]